MEVRVPALRPSPRREHGNTQGSDPLPACPCLASSPSGNPSSSSSCLSGNFSLRFMAQRQGLSASLDRVLAQ